MPPRSLDRILQSQGFGTRKQCAARIRSGRVTVEGALVRKPTEHYELEGLVVCVDDVEWRCASRCYLALNKPPGVECSRNPSHHPSVMQLLPAHLAQRVQPVGRLDQDSTGLLLLTDDGGFNHAISSPRRHVSKRYQVTTRAPVTDALVTALRTGVQLHREPQPIAASSCVQTGDRQLELTISQGKYHQVKRMVAAAGGTCVALCRIAIGGLELGALGLDEGEYQRLGEPELELLRES